jgi:hypothetical protein
MIKLRLNINGGRLFMKLKFKLSALVMSLMMGVTSFCAVSSQNVNASENVSKSASASVTEKAKEVSDEKEIVDEKKLKNMSNKEIDEYVNELKKGDDVKEYIKAEHILYKKYVTGFIVGDLILIGVGTIFGVLNLVPSLVISSVLSSSLMCVRFLA